MAPSEVSILSDFLLTPAPLSATITLQQFTALFPRSLQASAQVQSLYRELQHQRAIDIDDVKKNIAAEVARGAQQRRQVIVARQQSMEQELGNLDERDLVMESELHGQFGSKSTTRPHTLETILPAMDDAILNMRIEVKDLERDIEQALKQARSAIGDLSDLRYGKFNAIPGVTGDPATEAAEGLRHVERLLDPTSSEG